MDSFELLVPKHWWSASTAPHCFLLIGWPGLFSKQRKGCHTHFLLQVKHILWSTTVQSKAFPITASFRRLRYQCLVCSTYLTWHENVWLDESYSSHPPPLRLPKCSLKTLKMCMGGEYEHGGIKESMLKLSRELHAAQRQGVFRNSLGAAWVLWLVELGGQDNLNMKTYIYSHAQ